MVPPIITILRRFTGEWAALLQPQATLAVCGEIGYTGWRDRAHAGHDHTIIHAANSPWEHGLQPPPPSLGLAVHGSGKPKELVTLIGESRTQYDRALFAPFAERSMLLIPSTTLHAIGTPIARKIVEGKDEEPERLQLRGWTAAELMAALTTPEVELYFAHRLGVPVGFNVAHICILHPDERTPSGNLTYDPKRFGVYWCNHHEKHGLPDRNYTLPQLFAYRETGLLERLNAGGTFVWRVRMAAKFGILPLPEIRWPDLPLPPTDASDQDMVRYAERIEVYEAVKLTYAIQALTGEKDVQLSRRYVACFARLTWTHGTAHAGKLAEEYIHWLHDMALIIRTRAYKSIKEPALYAPCPLMKEMYEDVPEVHEDRVAEAMETPELVPGHAR
jgi:hypothetical protein